MDELKTLFFANVSHELRTHAALILGPVEGLLQSHDLSREQRQQLQVVDRNARTLLQHVNDLLDLAKLEAGQYGVVESPMDLAELLRLTAANFEAVAQGRHITLAVDAPEQVPVLGDTGKLQRVFLNLLTNAFQYAPEGGLVRCTLEVSEHCVTAAIEDNGPGVPQALRQTIFERFRQGELPATRLWEGTGLGLAIAKEFVELHGGAIAVVDAPKGGAIFRIELPLKSAAPGQPADADRPSERRPESMGHAIDVELLDNIAPEHLAVDDSGAAPERERPLVLIVEDDRQMNGLLVTILETDYSTASAFDGAEGLQKAAALRPDLIVCDGTMPDLSGDQLVRQLRSRAEFEKTPIVMLTAEADDRPGLDLLENFVQDFVTKPVQGRELRARVKNLVSLQQSQAALFRSQQEIRTLASRLIADYEDERSRLARELHDGITQRLAALAIQAGTLLERLPQPQDQLRARLTTLEERLIAVSDEVRRFSHQLYPASLEYVGLVAALRTHCREFVEETGIPTNVEVNRDPPSLPREISTCLFRIAQEGLRNVARHAAANKVRVALSAGPREITLSIIDNGVGFEVGEARRKGGLGLISMEERARSLGGVFSVSSAQREGTAVIVVIPLSAAATADSAH